MDFDLCLLHAPVGQGFLDDLRNLLGFAEGLHGDARNGRDLFGWMSERSGHQLLPILLIESAFVVHVVTGSVPLRTASMARVRMGVSAGSSSAGATRSRGSATSAAREA